MYKHEQMFLNLLEIYCSCIWNNMTDNYAKSETSPKTLPVV